MRSLISNRPLLGAALCLGLGIYIGVATNLSPLFWAAVFTFVALGWLAFPRWRQKGSFFTACVLMMTVGAFLAILPRTRMNSLQEKLSPINGRPIAIRAQVAGEAKWTRWGWQIPIRVDDLEGREINGFRSEWQLPLSETPPYPGMVIEMKGRWRLTPLERIPSRQERDGLCGRMTAESWRQHGRVITLNGRLYDFKRRLERIGEATLSLQTAEVLHGMAFNEPIVDQTLIEAFRRVGVVHILSVGGLHIGFLAVLLVGLGLALRLPKKGIYSGVLAVLPFFILMVGAGPPAVRAGIMSALVILGFLMERRVDGLNLWGAAALAVLLFKPLDLFDLGFQLSFGASGSILWLFPIWRKSVSPAWRPLTDTIFLSLAAQVGVLPLLAVHFGTFPWVGVIANLIVIPFSTVAVQLGLAAEVCGLLWHPLAIALNTSNEFILGWMIGLIRWFAGWGVPFPLPLFNGWGVLLYYLGIFAAVGMREVNPITRQYRVPQWAQVLILIIALSAGTGWVLAQAPPDRLRVEVIDVGQGDAILLTAPGGKRLLIDGGPGESYKSCLNPFLRRHMVNRLDVVVLTHAHEDHVGGLTKLLEQRQVVVGEVFDPGIPHTSRVYERFLTGLIEQKIPYRKAYRGMRFKLGREVNAEILWPLAADADDRDLNHQSVVIRVNYGQSHLLFMGDADKAAELELVSLEGGRLRAQILKVGHHGSAYSSSREFLETVRPNIAVISVGKGNSFGHPNRGSLNRLRKSGAVSYRTDRGGSVIIDFINRTQVKIRRETR